MKAKDIFTIILKVIGIITIKDLLIALPSLLAFASEYPGYDRGTFFLALIALIIPIAFYISLIYLLLFRTEIIITKLKLESNLTSEPLLINMHRSSILSIAIIIVGLLFIGWAIPPLIKNLYYWYSFNKTSGGIMSNQSYKFDEIIYLAAQMIIGLLLLGNQRVLINFIELKRKASEGVRE
jgi:hypothetical protein